MNVANNEKPVFRAVVPGVQPANNLAQAAAVPVNDPDNGTPRDPTAGAFCREALSYDELEDMVSGCVADYPPTRVELAKRNRSLGWDYLGAIPGGEFSLDDFSRRFGPGEYRAVCKLPDRRKKGLRFTVAAPAAAGDSYAPSGLSVPAPSSGTSTEALLAAVLSKLSTPAPAQPAAASPLDLNQLIIQQMQGQQNLLQALIVKTLDKPDPTGNKISELEQMLKLAERLGRKSGDADAGESGGLLELGKTLATAWLTSGAMAPAPAPVVIDRQKRIAVEAYRKASTLPAPAPDPAQPVTNDQEQNTLARAGGAATAQKTTGAGADIVEPMNPIAMMIRRDKRAVALQTLIAASDDDTQAESVADVAIGVLGDNLRELVNRFPDGTFASMFLAAFPTLEPKRVFMTEVEKKIREMLSADNKNEKQPGDDDADQPSPDNQDDNKESE